MSEYLALYRKWRPSVFADVIGQDHITKVLRSEIMQHSVSHAYLFCGSRGTGKTTCAKILAKAVSCENPVGGDPCGKCPKCLAFEKSLDITEMDAASNNSVNDIRELRERISFMPIELSRRVYIIDEVHMLSNSAFNALLKTLEEPPAHVMFILATTELNKIPATILSRCKRFDFHRISPEDMLPRLKEISDAEGIGIDTSALRLIARLASGAMRDALSMLELFVGQTGIDREKAAGMLGVIGNEAVLQLLKNIADKNCAAALENVADAYKSSKDMSVLCSELAEMFRNLLTMKYASSGVSKLIDETDDVISALRECEDKFSPERLLYCTDIIEDTQSKLSRNGLSRKTLIELMVMRLCDSRLSISPSALLERVNTLEAKASYADIPAKAATEQFSEKTNVRERPIAENAKSKNSDISHIYDTQAPNVSASKPEETYITDGFEQTDAEKNNGNFISERHGEKSETKSSSKTESFAKSEPTSYSENSAKPMSAFAEVLEDLKLQNMMLYSLIHEANAMLDGDTVILPLPSIAKFMITSDQSLKTQIENICSAKLGYKVTLSVIELTQQGGSGRTSLDNF